MTCEGEKLRLIMYGPFRIVERIGTNAFHLDLLSYMHIYSIVNVENLNLYQPPLIMDEVEDVEVPTIDDLELEYLDELQEDAILDRRTRNSCQGDLEYL